MAKLSNFGSPLTTMSTSVTASKANEDMIIPISSSELLEGLEDKIQLFLGVTNMRKVVDSRIKDLQAGRTTDQFLVFKPVTTDDLDEIDNKIRRHLRVAHCIDLDTLRVKLMPLLRHEVAHRSFGELLKIQSYAMGFSPFGFFDVGGTRYHGHSVSKEADTTFQHLSL